MFKLINGRQVWVAPIDRQRPGVRAAILELYATEALMRAPRSGFAPWRCPHLASQDDPASNLTILDLRDGSSINALHAGLAPTVIIGKDGRRLFLDKAA